MKASATRKIRRFLGSIEPAGWIVGCRGPSIPVKHAGRKMLAARLAHPFGRAQGRHTPVRKKMPAAPVPSTPLRAGGMTEFGGRGLA
jgi:hypothetical protein